MFDFTLTILNTCRERILATLEKMIPVKADIEIKERLMIEFRLVLEIHEQQIRAHERKKCREIAEWGMKEQTAISFSWNKALSEYIIELDKRDEAILETEKRKKCKL